MPLRNFDAKLENKTEGGTLVEPITKMSPAGPIHVGEKEITGILMMKRLCFNTYDKVDANMDADQRGRLYRIGTLLEKGGNIELEKGDIETLLTRLKDIGGMLNISVYGQLKDMLELDIPKETRLHNSGTGNKTSA